MNIKWIKTFVVTAKCENFRMASDELFLTQPAITKHIKRLEEALHIQLFERKGKAVFLTEAGANFLPHAISMLNAFEHGMEDFESWKQGYNRKLTIAAAPQIASSFLPRLLRRFMDKHPELEVIIKVVSSYDIGGEVSEGRVDLGLSRIHPVQTNVTAEIIHEELVSLIAPKECLRLKDLDEGTIFENYRIITHNHPLYWDNLLVEIKQTYPMVQTMEVNQMEVTKRFIEENLGVSYLPISIVEKELVEGKMIEVKSEVINSPKSLTYSVSKIDTKEVATFLEFLKESTFQ